MKRLMASLSDFLTRRRWFVLAAWVAVVLFAMPLASKQTENLVSGGFEVPGSQSAIVEDALSDDFDPAQSGGMGAVLTVEKGASRAQIDSGVARFQAEVAEQGDARMTAQAATAARADLRSAGVAVVPLTTSLPASSLTDTASHLREQVELGVAENGVTPYLTGQPAAYAGLQELSREDLEQAEVIGFPIVALILLAVFGSAAAAALPLTLGFVAVIITGALIYIISQQMQMSVFVTNMASMIGIGVAVDYSLFILARFREEVRAGKTARDARAEALSTSGLAVAFSGAAVVISLAGLWMVENGALRSMALGAMMVVAVAVLVATTLLPVLIRLLGHRVEAGGWVWRLLGALRHPFRRRRRRGSTNPDRPDFWKRWTERVMRRPVLSAVASASILLVLAVPVLDMETGNSPVEQFPSDHDVGVGAELAQANTGGGANPIETIADFNRGAVEDPANGRAASSFSADARRDPEVARVDAPVPGAGGSALIAVYPRHPSESQKAQDLVQRLRTEIAPSSQLADRASVAVGGETARIKDIRAQIDGSMWRIIGFVLALSFLVLMLMLRSLVLPLKAIVMNLLSIGAAYGVLVVVFQWGWLDGLLGFESLGAIDTLNPPLILAVVFGLSKDYEVFLLSRIRERYHVHGDNTRAVAEGLSGSARTISSAALIMTSVFMVFVLTGVPSIKELGFGTAVAIALDATLVRLVLVPAAMQLMGKWNWWLPKWLDRILPDLDLEGSKPQRDPTAPEAARA
jgi:RND superfamily putative drug exporter